MSYFISLILRHTGAALSWLIAPNRVINYKRSRAGCSDLYLYVTWRRVTRDILDQNTYTTGFNKHIKTGIGRQP